MKQESLNPDAGEAETIFNAALAFSVAERPAYLAGACRDNLPLRQRVEALLRAHEAPQRFLPDEPAAAPRSTIVLDPISETPGTLIGRYKLLQQIGEGGCGVVYMAEQQEPVRRRVALKVIKLGMDTKQVIARFEAERQALALMDHPNIAKVLDAGAETGRPYFVMELVKGIPITRFCDENNLTTVTRLGLFVQVCQAIQHAHQKGIIHRDIKPSNILVADHDGVPVPKIIDFGIAKATTDQRLTDKTLFTAFEQFIGTPAYMSPEQAKLSGLDVDTRSDIYSLGVLLYELLTGKTPFEGKRLLEAGLDEIRRIIREEEPMRPSTRLHTLDAAEQTTVAKHRQSDAPKLVHLIRGDLDWIVMKCLEKDRGRRYETANGLAMDLLRHLNNEAVTARPPSNAYRFQKMVRRNKLVFAAGAALAVVVVIGLAVSTFLFIQERRAHGRALAAEYEQSQLRKEAEAESKKAKSEAQRAEAAALEVKRTMAASDFSLAARLIAENDQSEALAYLGRSLSLNPTNDAVATRLATLLASHSWWVPMRSFQTGNGVYSARFSPDGKRIVTSSDLGIARVWDATSGQPLTGPMEPLGRAEWLDAQSGDNDLTEALKRKLGGRLSVAQFSPDGTRIITASADRTVRQWDALSGQPLTEPLTLPFKGIAWSAQFSPDGRRIVVAALDKTVRVWDAQTGKSLTEFKTSGGISSLQFSSDGQRIITGSTDRTAQVWDAQSGQPLTGPLKLESPVIAVQFSPDGNQIVTGCADGIARMWDVQSGQPLLGPLKHSGFVLSVQFSPDGKRIVTGSDDGSARVWDVRSGQPLTGPLTHRSFVHSAQFSPDGKRILTISGNSLYLWEPVGGPSVPESFETDAYAQFSQDGKRLLTSHFVNAALTARVWDVESGQPLSEQFKPGASEHASIPLVQFSPDGNRIVMISEGRTEEIAPDGNKVIKVFADQSARVWDARSGQPVTGPLEHSNIVQSAQFSPDGTRVVTASWDRTARVWNALTGQAVSRPLTHDSFVNSARFSPDGSRIVTASKDKTARVWDVQTGQPLTEPIKHSGAVDAAQFSPDGRRIVTGSSDGSARVWDAQSGQPLTGPLKHSGPITSVQFSLDGRRIATSSADGTARVWDAQTGEALTPPLKHGNIVLSAQFSRDGKRIVTASWDKTARVWDASSGQPLIEPIKHGNTVFSAQFSPDGRRIFTTSMSDAARVWDLSPSAPNYADWLLPLAEVISGETLNHQGMLEATKLNRGDMLNQIRQRLFQESDDDQWVRWGRWFLADPATRTISPFSKITAPDYVESRIKEGTIASLAEAESLASDNAKLSERIAEARGTLDQKSRLQKLWQEADALGAQGKFTKAQPQYAEALDLSSKLNGREHPLTLQTMINLANALAAQGKFAEAQPQYAEALDLSAKLNGREHPLTLQAMANLANVYFSLGRHREAIALLQKICEVDTKDTLASLALATWQTWFGQDADYEATCRRLVQKAQGTDEPSTAERAAKAACLQPSADAAMRTNALKLAQRAVELGKGSSLLPWYQLCLGLTEYRIGKYADAEETLTIAEHAAGDQHEIQGTAHFFRAMSLFRQSRIEEARKLFSQEAAQMPPIPKDEGKPLVDGRPVSHDVLIWWLAYKEAKSALNEPFAAKP